MVHCSRNCDCLLDCLWHTIHGWRMGLATSFPYPNDSQFCPRRPHIGIGLGESNICWGDRLSLIRLYFIGINALVYYSPTIFKTMGLNLSMQLVMSGVLNVGRLVGVTTSIWGMHVVGLRKLLLVSVALMALSHIIIAALVGILSIDWPSHQAEG
ncbi:Major facilitator superfamily domain general substrate transporter [Penicillium paradoxum]|uniref:Major facilitator superfamily domain general substrate transporter n=1 Tax=Penicillium paradoxum TaxID=176176 RepID=UPI002548DDF4|nr:Major facilitator superfamily domain general substrate transporter [Penicillium paradoxum]KAJ5779092.1 Major facilitator superfamily domain general substrate transporter [Penicillium paradoxum]